jgi:hypothetical protein
LTNTPISHFSVRSEHGVTVSGAVDTDNYRLPEPPIAAVRKQVPLIFF